MRHVLLAFLVALLPLGCQRAPDRSSTPPAPPNKAALKDAGGPETIALPKEKGKEDKEKASANPEDDAVKALRAAEVRIRKSEDGAVWTVKLTDRDLTDDGSLREDRLKGLKGLQKPVELSAAKCRFSNAGIEQLADVPALRALVLASVKVSKLDALARMKGLKALYLEQVPVKDEGLAPLAGMKDLKGLTLRSVNLTDAGLKNLVGLTGLTQLHISKADISSAGLRSLMALTALEELEIADCPKVTDEGLDNIKALTKVEGLNLAGDPFTDKSLEHLKAMPALKVLELQGTKITDKGVEVLTEMKGLEFLNIQRTQISEASIGKLQKALPAATVQH